MIRSHAVALTSRHQHLLLLVVALFIVAVSWRQSRLGSGPDPRDPREPVVAVTPRSQPQAASASSRAISSSSFHAIAAEMQGTQLRELNDPGTGLSALFYTPKETSEPLPLLLYLHGAGESGRNVRDIISEGATGTPPVELEHGTALPIVAEKFIVVAPQTNRGWRPTEVNRFLDYLLSENSGLPTIDATRCYVTGHSMGGGGALHAAAAKPSRWAAAVAVAPAGAPRAEDLMSTPVWCFHGKNDVVVPSSVSERLVQELRAGGADEANAKLTLYDAAPAPKGWDMYDGHGSPMPAYATPELWEWLLEKSLGSVDAS